jgi:hypothetical protein
MSGRRRLRASWLLAVLFTSMSFGVCTTGLSDAGGKLPCCPDVPAERASLRACCPTGQQSSELGAPLGVQVPPSPTSEIAFEVRPQRPLDGLSRRRAFSAIPYASADPQALLSTFLI